MAFYTELAKLLEYMASLERLVARQLLDHVHKLLPSLQSAYRAQHSTETAVLKVLSDILTAADRGGLSMLTLHDLSAAFDTVDHPILLRRLMTSYGLNSSRGLGVNFLPAKGFKRGPPIV